MDGHLLHGGEDDEAVGVQLAGQAGGGKVLVDDRRRALEVEALGLEHGDTAAAAGNDHQTGVHHVLNGLNLHDGLGTGRGHHTAVAASGVLHHGVVALFHKDVGLLLGHEGADGLGGLGEGGVVGVHLHLGQHGGNALLDAAAEHLLPQRVLQIVADVALAHGHADGQRAGNVFFRVGAGQLGHGVLDHAHLGAVAVGNDHLMALFNQIHDGAGGLAHRNHLLRQIVAQRVAAQGDDDSFSHSSYTSK